MSLDRAIEHHKERRKPYTGSKFIDKTCRNHGSCDWCRESSDTFNKSWQTGRSNDKRFSRGTFRW